VTTDSQVNLEHAAKLLGVAELAQALTTLRTVTRGGSPPQTHSPPISLERALGSELLLLPL
jgi:hypothetical protein